MKEIACITHEYLGLEPDNTEIKSIRYAARLILQNSENKIALIYSDKNGHHKLPGGGIEGDESPEIAAAREAKEEVGCNSVIIGEKVGFITEIKSKDGRKQVSTLFLARVDGEIGSRELTQHEIDQGFHEPIWVDIDTAIGLLEKDEPKTYIGSFMRARDLELLKAAKTLIG